MIRFCFLLFGEDSHSFLFFVFSVVSNFIWLFENVSNFLMVVLGFCSSGLGCSHCKVVLGCFGSFNLHTLLFVFGKFL